MKRIASIFLFAALITEIMTPCVSAQDEKSTNTVVVMTTNMGVIEVELFSDKAPVTVSNFLSYVLESFYDGTIFHRVIEGFMIQGGGFTPDMVKKPTKPMIKSEATNKLSNRRGTISMARMPNGVDTASSQFFINHKGNPGLDHKDKSLKGFGYCVFGQVIAGMDVVDKIASTSTTTARDPKGTPLRDVPARTITIESIRIKE